MDEQTYTAHYERAEDADGDVPVWYQLNGYGHTECVSVPGTAFYASEFPRGCRLSITANLYVPEN